MATENSKEIEVAFRFAENVMFHKFENEFADYTEPKDAQDALRQLKSKAVDMSEHMAIRKLEGAGVSL